VFESQSPRLAVLLAAQAATATGEVRLADVAEAAMAALEAHTDVRNVRYALTALPPQSGPRLRLSGVFQRAAFPVVWSAVVGADGGRGWQVLTFFSDAQGARMAERVLSSVRPVVTAPK